MRLLYALLSLLIWPALRLAALFNPKARLAVDGRRGLLKRLAEEIDPSAPLAWFHAASLGEFEQGRPVIEAFAARNPDYKILVTFFSPSGYEIRKNYAGADYICYLPTDTPRNVRRFLAITQPRVAVFIKYEFWINYLLGLRRIGCRTYLISAIFRPSQPFFRWYGGLFRRALHCFDHLFVQNAESVELLKRIGITEASVTGDTRFDRVYAIAQAAKELPFMETFADDSPVFVAGSTWPPDEQLLVQLINLHPQTKFVIAPHEIDSTRIERLIARIERPALRYTQLTAKSNLAGCQVLFIDTIGLLSSLYRYGRYGYIGGGFGVGIHNTLEAATFGLPLAFGPNYKKFKEACDLIEVGGACSISDFQTLCDWFNDLSSNGMKRKKVGTVCADYVIKQKGATQQIIAKICR